MTATPTDSTCEVEDRNRASSALLGAFRESRDPRSYASAVEAKLEAFLGPGAVELRLGDGSAPGAVPVRYADRTLGQFVPRPGAEDRFRRPLLEAVAPVVAACLDRHRAEGELRRSRETERSLFAIEALATSAASVDDLLAGVTRELKGLSWVAPNLGASILLVGGRHPQPSFGCPHHEIGATPPCFRTEEPGVDELITETDRRICPAARTRCRVPIRAAGGRIEGTLHVCLAEGAFEADAVRFLETVALVVAKTLRRRRAEERFLQAQKLEVLGRLAGGIAHDFNNLLAVILSTAEVLRQELGPDHPSREDAEDILDAARRGVGLTRQLLAFSRRRDAVDEVIAPCHTLAGLEKLLRRTLGSGIRLEIAVDPDAGQVRIDHGHLEQVLLNLAVNARDAMPDGGTLRIELARELAGAGPAELPPGEYVRISVADTGKGIPPDALPRIFDPFFTTKAERGGTGLGLATVQEIVLRARGHVGVWSAPGRGARFDVRLPVAAVEPAFAAASS